MSIQQQEDDEPLFDSKLLEGLQLQEGIQNDIPGLLLRPLQPSDYDRGFLQLLAELTEVGKVTQDQFNARLKSMRTCPCTYLITVAEDKDSGKVVAAATLVLEQKFIHQCALKGHIEDVVVGESWRGRRLGKFLVGSMIALAKRLGCYKLILECKDALVPFYSSLGLVREPNNANALCLRFPLPKL